LRYEGTKIWRDEILGKRYGNIDVEMGIRRIVGCENKEQWQKIGTQIIKLLWVKRNGEKLVRK
jgi:hypothetical protein